MNKKIILAMGIAAIAGAAILFLKQGFHKDIGENPSGSAALIGPTGLKQTAPGDSAPKAGDAGGKNAGAPGEQQKIAAAAGAGGGGTTALAGLTSEDTAYLQAPPLSEKEIKSMKTLLNTFHNTRGRAALNQFIKELTLAHLKPRMAKDENPYTGKMLVVRTQDALEGTRYLHAQYFEDGDKNKEPFLQHISFEIRPSPNCMAEARAYIEATLGKKLPPPEKPPTDSWAEWKVDGYSWWVHRLAREDIPDHPFNARTMADIGACQVARELIPDEGHE